MQSKKPKEEQVLTIHSQPAEIVSLTNPKSPVAEAYHTLRTNILFAGLDKPLKSLLVTSPLPQSGKTTTVANLGVTIARTGTRVLILDADLRRPTQHKVFHVENKAGLTTLLINDRAVLNEVISETGVENLSLLTSGPLPPNPSELIVTKAFTSLMKQLKQDYDFILVDSPPLIAVTDPALLSRFVDGTILVVDFGRIPKEVAQKLKEQLDNVRANTIGVILNKIPSNGQGYYYYYYARYYGEGEESKGLFGRGGRKRNGRPAESTKKSWLRSLFFR